MGLMGTEAYFSRSKIIPYKADKFTGWQNQNICPKIALLVERRRDSREWSRHWHDGS